MSQETAKKLSDEKWGVRLRGQKKALDKMS